MTLIVPGEISISTATCLAKLDISLDIEAIFNNVDINDTIIGVKCGLKVRGDMNSKKGSFFNQASIKIFVKELDKIVNLKFFTNGTIQVSGIKTKEDAYIAIKFFIECIKDISGTEDVFVIVKDNIVFDLEDYTKYSGLPASRYNNIKIYGKKQNSSNVEVIGVKKGDDTFFIKGKKMNRFDIFFLDYTHKLFEKNVYNLSTGEKIGVCKYTLIKPRKNLILKGCTFSKISEIISTNDLVSANKYTYEIYNKYGSLYGHMDITIHQSDPYYIWPKLENVTVEYVVIKNKEIDIEKLLSNNSDTSFFESFKITNINSVIDLNLEKNQSIDREVMHNILINKYNINSSYKPSLNYQAINVKLYFDSNNNIFDGRKSTKKASTCDDASTIYRFSCLIFRNGKIIISGCINIQQIQVVKDYLTKLINDNADTFVKVIDQNPEFKESEFDKNIKLWDLL